TLSQSTVRSIEVLSDGSLVTAGDDYQFKFWNLTTGGLIRMISSVHTNYIYSIKQLYNGNLASCSHDGYVKVWSTVNYTMLYSYYINSYGCHSLELHPNGNIITANYDGIRYFNAINLNLISSITITN